MLTIPVSELCWGMSYLSDKNIEFSLCDFRSGIYGNYYQFIVDGVETGCITHDKSLMTLSIVEIAVDRLQFMRNSGIICD